MSFILESPSGAYIKINVWNWRPTMLLVREALGLPDERFELMQCNVGAELSSCEAERVADFLTDYLERLPKEGRLLLDGSTTREPKGPLDFDDGDWDRHYSANYDWLVRFRDFCRSSKGFKVY